MKNMQQIKTGNISEGIEFIQTTELEEETKEYIKKVYENTGYEAYPHSDANTLNRSEGFKDGVKSDAARDYWYAQFQQEQSKPVLSDEEIEKMAENIATECYKDHNTSKDIIRIIKAALVCSAAGWSDEDMRNAFNGGKTREWEG